MWLQQPEGPSGEFEGRTSEEAVRKARAALGDEAAVRCWKTRRGGVLGFFAREAFVAGTEPPVGAIKRVKTSSRPPRPGDPAKKEAAAPAPVPQPQPQPHPQQATLSQLVERTSDELTLGSDPVAAAVFSEVLAEAQAAVYGTDVRVRAPEVEADDPGAAPGPERIEGLLDRLARMGVPVEYRPREEDATLDGLTRALARLPRPQSPPALGGSVIVVVGGRREAHRAAAQVMAGLALGPTDLLVVDRTDAGRQRVARRRSANKVTVLVVETTLNARGLASVADWVDRIDPDHVLGAVPATAKRSDVEHWCAHFGRMDGLALSGLADTATPAELMGRFPIAFLNERPASPLRWTMTLLGTMLEHDA
jgi:hypothetical protein